MAGLECEFVEKPPQAVQSVCPICLLVLREPYQATCCGKSFCKVCIEPVKTANQACPTCKDGNFNVFHNKGLQQSLYDFQVYCPHKSKGCEWTGELKELDNHLNSDPPADKSLEGCPFAEISCPLDCEVKLPRNEMKSHINGDILGHFLKQASQVTALKTQLNSCKQDLVQVTRDNQHLQQKVSRLEEKNTQLERQLVGFRVNQDVWPHFQPVDFTVANYQQLKEDYKRWYSEPFYSHPRGYMMCLGVTNGYSGSGDETYLAVNVHIMQGEFDEFLKWPFHGEVTIYLLRQNEQGRPLEKTVIYSDDTDYGCTDRVIHMNTMRAKGHGFRKFITHARLEQTYVKNDSIKFRIHNVTLS